MSDLRAAAERVLAEYDNDSVGFKLFGALEDLRAALAEDALERMSEDERRLGIQMQPSEPMAHVSYLKSDDETYGWNGNDAA